MIPLLQDLSRMIFQLLFKEADTQREKKMIKILVEYCSYPCLLVGLLLDNPNFKTFQGIMDGVGTGLIRKYHSS